MRAARRTALPAQSSLLHGLIGYWPMNESSGYAQDYIGACTLKPGTAPAVAAGWLYSTARDFAKSTHHHLIGVQSEEIFSLDAFTVAVWEYPYSYTGVPSEYNSLIMTGTAAEPGFWFFHTHDGGLVLFVSDGMSGTEGMHSSLFPTLNAWNCALAWHDPAADTINVQLNGGTVASQAYTNGLGRSFEGLRIGCNADMTEDWFDGRIGPIALWNRVLTAGERADIYANGRGWKYQGPHRLPPQINIPWAVVGGAPMPVLAYQGKGAKSLVDSCTNLANPGYKNLLRSNGDPAWDAIRGWKFDNANYLALFTNYIPGADGTMIVRFANDIGAQNCYLTGSNTSGANYAFTPWQGGFSQAAYGNTTVNTTSQSSGVIAVNADGLYYNGSLDQAISGETFGTSTLGFSIGSIIPAAKARTCDITHWMFYDETLTADMIAAISSAVAAL